MYKINNPLNQVFQGMNQAAGTFGSMTKNIKQNVPGPTVGGALSNGLGGAMAGASLGSLTGGALGLGLGAFTGLGALVGIGSYLFS